MSFYRDDTMEKLEALLGLKGEYREDQSGYPFIANREFRRKEKGQDLDARWYNAPPLGEDWHRLYLALHSLLEKHPELMAELPEFKGR